MNFCGQQVTFGAFTDELAADNAQPALTLLDLFLNEIPFLILAVAGVGLFIRRNAAGTAVRLGLARPAWWPVALGLAAARAVFALGQGSEAPSHPWTPPV